MEYKLFLNKCWGVDFMLTRKLDNAKIPYDYISLYEEEHKDTDGLYKKHNVKSTPCLLTLDNGLETGRLKGIDEIVEYLKNVSNTKI